MSKVLSIVGMGAGISKAVADRFAREGFTLAMIARNEGRLSLLQELYEKELIYSRYYVADAGEAESLRKAFAAIQDELGPTSVLLYNASRSKKLDILQENMESLAADFNINVGGALEAAKAVIPAMKQQGQGTILLTGGGLALHPNAEHGSLSIGKAGIRSLAYLLRQSLKGTGIKVATLTVAGFVSPQSEKHTPENIAEIFWQLYQSESPDVETVL